MKLGKFRTNCRHRHPCAETTLNLLVGGSIPPGLTILQRFVTVAFLEVTESPAGPGVMMRLDQPLDVAVEALERAFIERALAQANGRVTDAAQLLGISRKGLFLKRKKLGLE